MRWILGVLVALLVGSVAEASITLIHDSECITMYPGDAVTKTLKVVVDEDGWYTIKVLSAGILAEPTEMDVYLEEGHPEYFPIVLRAPANVVEEEFTVSIDLYSEDREYIETEMFCVRVVRDYGDVRDHYAEPDFMFSAGAYYEEGGYIIVPLYIQSDERRIVELDSDYENVIFEKTSIVADYGEKIRVDAMIPSGVAIPDRIRFYAFSNGTRKEIIVKLPRVTLEKRTVISAPERIELKTDLMRVPVTIKNVGNTNVRITLNIEGGPFGVKAISDVIDLLPGEERTVSMLVTARSVFGSGSYPVQVCAEEDHTVTGCTHTILVIPEPEKLEANVETKRTEKVVTLIVRNGPKTQRDISVDVDAPTGWIVRVDPEKFDLAPYEKEEITVRFTPGRNAEDGTAYVEVVSGNGDVITRETVPLSKSELTGYAYAFAPPVWILVAIAVIVLVIFMVGRKERNGSADIEEIKAEVTKK